jgi:hypothetical protein
VVRTDRTRDVALRRSALPDTVARMYVETVVQINDRDTYQASVRLRSAAVSSRPPVDALVRFSPAGWLTMKPLSGGRVVVVSAAEVLDVSNIERVQAGEEPLR